MGGCSAPNCSNSTTIGKQLFRFPKDAERRRIWAVNCRRDFEPPPHSRLCQVGGTTVYIMSNNDMHLQRGRHSFNHNDITIIQDWGRPWAINGGGSQWMTRYVATIPLNVYIPSMCCGCQVLKWLHFAIITTGSCERTVLHHDHLCTGNQKPSNRNSFTSSLWYVGSTGPLLDGYQTF